MYNKTCKHINLTVEQKQQLLETARLIDPVIAEGHVWLFQCKCKVKKDKFDIGSVCNAKFRTLELLERHHSRRHEGKVKYERILVDADYIKNRKDQCSTRGLRLYHRDEMGYKSSKGCQHERHIPNSCMLRNCPKCEAVRSKRSKDTYERYNVAGRFRRISFLTLTHRGHHKMSRRLKKDLEYSIKKFMDMLRYRCKGYPIQYIRVMEIVEKKRGMYYYHYHYEIDIPYIDQKILSKMWLKATGNISFIVDIRNVARKSKERDRWIFAHNKEENRKYNVGDVTRYITKYLTKPLGNVSDDKYSVYVYRAKFVETVFSSLVTGFNGRGKSDLYLCPCCGDMFNGIDYCTSCVKSGDNG